MHDCPEQRCRASSSYRSVASRRGGSTVACVVRDVLQLLKNVGSVHYMQRAIDSAEDAT